MRPNIWVLSKHTENRVCYNSLQGIQAGGAMSMGPSLSQKQWIMKQAPTGFLGPIIHSSSCTMVIQDAVIGVFTQWKLTSATN